MSTRKYFGETAGQQHGGHKLHWPGTPDGFPVLAAPGVQPNIKQDELDNIDFRLDFKSKMFELWDVSQKTEFDDINDKIVNGWYMLQRRENHWDEEKKHYRVWLEWCQVYGMIPPK